MYDDFKIDQIVQNLRLDDKLNKAYRGILNGEIFIDRVYLI